MHGADASLPGVQGRSPSRWLALVLGAVVLTTAVGRAWVIGHYAEPDGDAKGHLGIAKALLTDPLSVRRHWVWPPGYHYFSRGSSGPAWTGRGSAT